MLGISIVMNLDLADRFRFLNFLATYVVFDEPWIRLTELPGPDAQFRTALAARIDASRVSYYRYPYDDAGVIRRTNF